MMGARKASLDEIVSTVKTKNPKWVMVHYEEDDKTHAPIFIMDKDGSYAIWDFKSSGIDNIQFNNEKFRMAIDAKRLIMLVIIWIIIFTVVYYFVRLLVVYYWNIDVSWYFFIILYLSCFLYEWLSKKLSVVFIKYFGKGAMRFTVKKQLKQVNGDSNSQMEKKKEPPQESIENRKD